MKLKFSVSILAISLFAHAPFALAGESKKINELDFNSSEQSYEIVPARNTRGKNKTHIDTSKINIKPLVSGRDIGKGSHKKRHKKNATKDISIATTTGAKGKMGRAAKKSSKKTNPPQVANNP